MCESELLVLILCACAFLCLRVKFFFLRLPCHLFMIQVRPGDFAVDLAHRLFLICSFILARSETDGFSCDLNIEQAWAALSREAGNGGVNVSSDGAGA